MGSHVKFNKKLKLHPSVIPQMKPSSPFHFHLKRKEQGIKG